MKRASQLNLVWQLLKADFIPFRNFFIGKLINACVWVGVATLVVGYIFPYMRMSHSFITLYVTGAPLSFGIFEINAIVLTFISNIAGDKSVMYPVGLPIKSYYWYLYLILSHAMRTGCFILILFPLIKLLLGNRLPLDQFSLIKFITIFISIIIFIATVAMLFVSIVKDISRGSDIWFRFLFPLWFFGGSQYSWQTLYQINPYLGYAAFFNPFLYAYEGLHAAFFGSIDYLPFGVCIFMLWIFIIVFGIWGFLRLKRWLDFV